MCRDHGLKLRAAVAHDQSALLQLSVVLCVCVRMCVHTRAYRDVNVSFIFFVFD